MKTPTPTQAKPTVRSPFQTAASLDVAPAVALKSKTPAPSQTPFVDLVLQPDKLEKALNSARAANDAFDAARTNSRNGAKGTRQNSPPKRVTVKRNTGNVPRQPRRVEFFLKAPSAKSVKLAADFTDWEKYPLDMMQNEDGFWFSFVPLEPGQYSYRFIVDGQWCDDPRSTRRVPNPFGTENALLDVT